MKAIVLILSFFLSLQLAVAAEPLNVIVFGAHPDDCDISTGGVAALFSQMGHKVRFVSLTNGNKGHQSMKPDELAARRKREMQEAGRILNVVYDNLDNNDGELMPTIENRKAVIKLICDWKADIVISCRPYDYHPDHRNTAIIVQDAAYMISVPLMVPDGQPLMKAPLFLYVSDRFQKPLPFSPDIVVDITSVAEKKAEAICAHESQVFEWLPWNGGWDKELPADATERRQYVGKRYLERDRVERFADAALKWYTSEQLRNIRYVEVFEICEYGSMPDKEKIKQLFPMLNLK
jgi:LmbE family N-acetylglucosaminyl deacetylase